MLESKVQAKCIKELESQGYYVIKLISTNRNGIADLIAIPRNSDVLFVEVKQKGKKPRPLQVYRANELKELGIKTKLYDGEWKDYE
jgi:hypothetical protein